MHGRQDRLTALTMPNAPFSTSANQELSQLFHRCNAAGVFVCDRLATVGFQPLSNPAKEMTLNTAADEGILLLVFKVSLQSESCEGNPKEHKDSATKRLLRLHCSLQYPVVSTARCSVKAKRQFIPALGSDERPNWPAARLDCAKASSWQCLSRSRARSKRPCLWRMRGRLLNESQVQQYACFPSLWARYP